MELKLARKEQSKKFESITLEKIEEEVLKKGHKIFYFDKENQHKDILALMDFFEKKGFSVYPQTIRYGLDENDYMYEVHIL